MYPLDCVLECHSSAEHLGQIFCGFAALRSRGLIRLAVRPAADYSGSIYGTPLAHATLSSQALNAPLRVTFDVSDTCAVPDDLYGSDYYFLRSYQRNLLCSHPLTNRIFPLGLNYGIFTKDSFFLRRALWSPKPKDAARLLAIHAKSLSRLLGIQNSAVSCDPSRFEGLPLYPAEPRVIFMTQAWLPSRVQDPEKKEERHRINSMRAACIEALRKEFKQRFIGGFAPDSYVRQNFPGCVVEDARLTTKARYLRTMQSCSIGIATRGLAGSTGWKFAEYVAAAKAIVTEPLLSEVPGSFGPEKNYLEFNSPDECVGQVARLMQEHTLRSDMMRANHAYYQCFVRPDALVWNALCTALSHPIEIHSAKMSLHAAHGN